MTAAQKTDVLNSLQKLTNDKLFIDAKSNKIKIASLAKSGTETKVNGTNLIRRLNSSDKNVTINIATPGSGNSEIDVNPTDAINGVGTDTNVYFDPTASPSIPTEDPVTGNVSGAPRPNEIGYAHELIHAERSMRGEAIDYSLTDTHTYKDATGATITQTVPLEELATVGLKGNTKKDITEIQIRKEQKQDKRGAY